MNNKTINSILLVVAILILLVIVGGVVFTSFSFGKSKFMKDFDKYYNKKENTIIYYASSQCGYCAMQKPILETIADAYDLDYLEIDSIKLSQKDREKVLDKLGIEHATPTTVIVNSGKIVDTAIGYRGGNEYVEFLKGAGVLPEDATYGKTVYKETPNLTIINYDEYKELVNSDEYVVVTVGQSGCSHCNAIRPALDDIVTKNGLKINYLNLTDMTRDETNDFFNGLLELGYDDEDFVEKGSFGTPTTFTIKNGKVEYYISGERTYSQLEREFIKQELIK